MSGAASDLDGELVDLRGAMAGALVDAHHGLPRRWEAGVPVDREGVPDGRVVPAVLPGGEVASIY
jgi:hypothetical protein